MRKQNTERKTARPEGPSRCLVLALSLAGWLLALLTVGVTRAEVPAVIQTQLARGINLSFWFTYRSDPSIDPRLFRPDEADLAALQRMGFRHARVAFDRSYLVDAANPSRANPQRASEFADALQRVAAHGMLAVATMSASPAEIRDMINDPASLKQAAGFWWSLARQLSARLPADQLMFEVLNEPGNDDAAASLRLMQTLAGSIRDAAPAYTIAVAGHQYSSVDELLALKPLQDGNIVYTFHFYEPFNFTHQGATWGWPMWAHFHDFPYPSSPAAVAPILPTLDEEARPHALYYGQQAWGRDKLAARLDAVSQWQRAHQVPVWCSEFGVVKAHAPPGAREAWLRDTRELLEARGIGWTHFDFTQHMGLVDGPQGARQWNRAAVQALGMSPPTAP